MSIEREVENHGVRLANIENSLSDIGRKLEPIFTYVIEDKERERIRESGKTYWELIKSGSIAAVVGALVGTITTYFMSGGNHAGP